MKNIRQVDLAARYSGDVLAIILANADAQPALEAMEKIRQSVERLSRGTTTVSMGLASFPRHATSGEGLIEKALEVIRHHHEKLDGSGYPDGLKGDEISVPARIMAVVDIYDALVTGRPYRKGMSKEKALGILQLEAEEGKLDKDRGICAVPFFQSGNVS